MRTINWLFLLLLPTLSFGGHFLFWLPFSSKSNKIGLMPMARELANRGHNVSIVSPYKEKKPIPGLVDINFDFSLEGLWDDVSEMVLSKELSTLDNMPFGMLFYLEPTLAANRAALSHPNVKRLLYDDSVKVDVVVILSMLDNEAGLYVADKKNASRVQWFSTPFTMPWMADALGAPTNPSYIQLPMFDFSQKMNFWQRTFNSLALVLFTLGRRYIVLPETEKMLAEVIQGPVPDLNRLAENSALGINWGNPFIADGLRPLLPNMIQAGLLGCHPGGALEGKLKDWVEGAKNGVVYVSLGSIVRAHMMPENKRKMMLSALSNLTQRVIWKWEKDMPDAPENVMISPWLPQTDILSHPNVNLFVTHGGAGSVQETICHKTPIVGIPINGDQITNIAQAVNRNIGLSVRWQELTEEKLLMSMERVLKDPVYQESVTRLQELMMDQPQHPLDKAVWWLEYLLRHPHNPEMKSPSQDLNLFQYLLLDVIVFIILVLVIMYLIIRKLIHLLVRLFFLRKSKTE